jgi:hypothetical protein
MTNARTVDGEPLGLPPLGSNWRGWSEDIPPRSMTVHVHAIHAALFNDVRPHVEVLFSTEGKRPVRRKLDAQTWARNVKWSKLRRVADTLEVPK